MKARTKSADDTRALAASLAELARPGDVILLTGDLGSGKTVFAQGFAKGLGVEDRVTSPTFTLARSYAGRLRLHHLDVYRLDHLQEAIDLGLAELVDDEAVALIEWGDVVASTLPADFLEVRLTFEDEDDDDERLITIRSVGPRWGPRNGAVERALGPWAC